MNDEIELIPYSFTKDLILMCSLGLNLGFIIGLMFI